MTVKTAHSFLNIMQKLSKQYDSCVIVINWDLKKYILQHTVHIVHVVNVLFSFILSVHVDQSRQ